MRAVLEQRLAGLIGIGEDRRIDVDDDLVEGCLREQRQRVGLLLGHRRRFRGSVAAVAPYTLWYPPRDLSPAMSTGEPKLVVVAP